MYYRRLILSASLLFAAAMASAVPHRLDSYHEPLARFYHNYVRQESRVAANKSYVRSVVKYALLKTDPQWPEYIAQLAYVDPITLRQAPDDARKAFWINSYNSFVLDAVAQNFPLPQVSTNDYPAGSFRGSTLWASEHFAAGGSYTLEAIRQQLLSFRDPRVFFAITDAANSSPALPDKPYTATNVEAALDATFANFLADPLNYRIDRARNRIVLSELFRTYAPQFRDVSARLVPEVSGYPADVRAVLGYIWQRLPAENREYITRRRPAVEYGKFDWELNVAR